MCRKTPKFFNEGSEISGVESGGVKSWPTGNLPA
jgi:hypothetical protein